MKSDFVLKTVILAGLVFMTPLAAFAADSASFVALDLPAPSSPQDTVSGVQNSQESAADETAGLEQDPISMPLANPQSLHVEEKTLEGGRLELGRFESRATLKFRDGEYSFFELAVSMRLADGTLKSALTSAEYRPGTTTLLDEDAMLDFETRFAAEVQSSMEPLLARYGVPVVSALTQLGIQYVRTSAAEIPRAIPALIEKARELESRGEGKAAPYPLTQLSGSKISDLSLRKEFSEKAEDLEVVRDAKQPGQMTPRFENRQKFILTDLAQNGNDRYFLAAIDYRCVTSPETGGKFKTVFTLSLRYKGESAIIHSESFVHESAVEERKFMPKWRSLLVSKAMDKLTAQAGTNREKVERALFVSYLEPYLYDLYYDFSPSLLKARLAFAGPEVQKQIRLLEKKRL